MNDREFRDACAASAVAGLISRYEGPDDELRHHYHVICIEAFRMADEMVEQRRLINEREAARKA